MNIFTAALWKGCLGGIGLVLVFFAISGIAYLILSLAGLPQRTILFVSVGSGPIIGTLGFSTILLVRALRAQTEMSNRKE